jgi:hypothetical protein
MPKKKQVVPKSKPVEETKVEVKTELTSVEEFWVEQNCKNGVSLEEVQAAGIEPLSLVESHYKKIQAEIQEEASTIKASSLFGRNEKYGAVVMTQNASEVGDGKKKQNNQEARSGSSKQTHIHKFRNR